MGKNDALMRFADTLDTIGGTGLFSPNKVQWHSPHCAAYNGQLLTSRD